MTLLERHFDSVLLFYIRKFKVVYGEACLNDIRCL